MLEVKNLTVGIGNKLIISDLNFRIDKGKVLVLFGPNGSGKTTLVKALMGFSGLNIKSGDIVFKGEKINSLPIEERVKLGLGIMYQYPPKIKGVKLEQIARFLCKNDEKIKKLSKLLSLEEHLKREINVGFSGGETKRAELFQLVLQGPQLLLMDEPESGVDIENISIMGKILSEYLKDKNKSALIITHTGYILDYISAELGCVMIDGKIWCFGDPKEIFSSIKKFGYDKCKRCEEKEKKH